MNATNAATEKGADLLAPGLVTMMVCGSVCSLYILLSCVAFCSQVNGCSLFYTACKLRTLLHFLAWPVTTLFAFGLESRASAATVTQDTIVYVPE